MPITIGFDDDRRRERTYMGGGALGSFGDSIAGAMSPSTGGGFGGAVRGFLNPGRYLEQDVQAQAKQELDAALQEAAPSLIAMKQGLTSGTPEGRQQAFGALEEAARIYGQHGLKVEPLYKQFEWLSTQADVTGMRRNKPSDPDYLDQMGGFITDPTQGAQLSRTGMQNRATGEDILSTQQTRELQGQAFPVEQEGRLLSNILTGARTQTEGARQGEIGARTGLVGVQTEGERTANQMSEEELNFARQNQMKMGTARPPGAGPQLPLIHTKDEQGNPIVLDRNTGERFPKSERPLDQIMRQEIQRGAAPAQAAEAPQEQQQAQRPRPPEPPPEILHESEAIKFYQEQGFSYNEAFAIVKELQQGSISRRGREER